MAGLEEWLSAHGLARHAATLAANDIDLDILPDLTDADLSALGLSLGDRRRLLKAVATLGSEAPQPQQPAPQAPIPKDAERRQVTVLFCDLVGSTELASAIDPEDMGRLIRRYQDGCAGAIARFDGFVAKFMGDGVLAYFGYPQAHEDAAERAVRAALAIIDTVGQIARPDGELLAARIGVATGLVVVGDIVGTGAAREESIVGETPNLAARLQALAEPNTILVAQRTQQLIGRLFEIRSIGAHALKGFAQPVPVWQVLREAPVASRFAAVRAASLFRFVGREPEMAMLLERWRLARQSEGQAVLLTGEAGIGKSRLVDELRARIREETQRRVRCQCSPYHTNSALYPVIRHIELAAGFTLDDAPAQKLEKLRAMLAGAGLAEGAAEATMSLLADLLALPADGRAAAPGTAEQRKEATIAALVALVTALAETAPVLFVLEDAHWIDPTTAELMTRLVDAIAAAPVLVVVTARPGFDPAWRGRPHAGALALGRLGRAQCAALVAAVAEARGVPAPLTDEIVAKTDGVPLFVEELTKSVLEAGTSGRSAVPETLQDSLMARLDRLGETKEIAQIAAVIGRQFPRALLAAVAPIGAAQLEAALARLVSAEIVFPQSRAIEESYVFKHALARDAAYESLLRSRRQQLHARIGGALEERFPERVQSEPELPAHHFAEAGLGDPASRYYERAGDRAAARSAYEEAVAHYAAALGQAEALAAGPERARRELALLLKLGPARAIILGLQSPEIEEIYDRAYTVGLPLGEGPDLFKAAWGRWLAANAGQRPEAPARADALIALGQRLQDDDLLLEAYHCRWSTATFRGDITTALADGREGIARYDQARHSRLADAFGGHDPGVCAYVVTGFMLLLRGEIAAGRAEIADALNLAEAIGHPHSLAHALYNATITSQFVGDHAATRRYAEQLVALSSKYNFPPQRASGAFLAGWSRAAQPVDAAEAAAGLAIMESEFPRAVAFAALRHFFTSLMAAALTRAGRAGEAVALLDKVLATVTEPGIGLFLPEAHRLRGECLLAHDAGARAAALDALAAAVAIAQRQGAPLLQLRAALSLARHGEAGRETLRATLASLPAGFDAPDLAAARRILG